MPLTKYHYEIEPIAQAYNEAISDRKVKDALTAKHGSYILEPENRAEFTNMAAEYKMQQLRIANDKIQAIKDRAKLEVDSLLTRYESEKVNLLTGSKLIDQYAQRHKLDRATAEGKLREYAKVKTAGFDINSIADQYAALWNAGKMNPGSNDDFVLSQIQKNYGIQISQYKAEVDNIMQVINNDPQTLMQDVSGGGHAILKMLQNQD